MSSGVSSRSYYALSPSKTTYSLQNALSINFMYPTPFGTFGFGFSYQNSTYAFSDACQIDGLPDCNAACSGDFGQMFDSLQTLHNCVVLPNITDSNWNFTTSGGQDERILSSQLKDSFGGSANRTANQAIPTIDTCLQDYCLQLQTNGCELPNTTQTLYDYLYMYNHTERFGESPYSDEMKTAIQRGYGSDLVSNICKSIEVRLDSDVGGIGVSYLYTAYGYVLD